MSGWWICYLPILLILLWSRRQEKENEKYYEARIRRRKGNTEMQELAKRLIGKDVLFYTVASGTVDGVLKEVTDNAAVIEKDGKETFINLDYVIRMREYPVDKKGKRKSVVLD